MRGPSPPPYRNPHTKVMLRYTHMDSNSTVWVFDLTARTTPPNLSSRTGRRSRRCSFCVVVCGTFRVLLKEPQHPRPGVEPIDLVTRLWLDYEAASAVPYRPAVFDSAVLGVCQHVAVPARHPGQHLPQIRRVVCLARRDPPRRMSCPRGRARCAVLRTASRL